MSSPKFIPIEERVPILVGEGWHGALRRSLEILLGLPEIRRRVDQAREQVAQGEQGFEALLKAMDFGMDARGVMEAIPREGPLVLAANHPFGGPEAAVLPVLATRVRPDVKVLGNNEVMALPDMERWMLPLEILGGEGAARKNLGILKQALVHLRNGGALVTFPAGAVAHWQWERARVEDPPWPPHTARIVKLSRAAVLPVRFFGQNGPIFQVLGAPHPFLRSALIPRAFLAMSGRTVRCRAGNLLKFSELPSDPEEMTGALRTAVEQVFSGDGN
ncbi:MAG: hypothetical protein VCA37_14420 [Roseibacillus sp.]